MEHGNLIHQVRAAAEQALRDEGAAGGAIRETILLRDGNYWARKFARGNASALWIADDNALQLLGADGQPLRTTPIVATETPPLRKAA